MVNGRYCLLCLPPGNAADQIGSQFPGAPGSSLADFAILSPCLVAQNYHRSRAQESRMPTINEKSPRNFELWAEWCTYSLNVPPKLAE
jgi:hypothetical protein